MPKCDEGYLSDFIGKTMKEYDMRSILEVANEVHMSVSGSLDKMEKEKMIKLLGCLQFYLKNWTESQNIKNKEFDDTVKSVLKISERLGRAQLLSDLDPTKRVDMIIDEDFFVIVDSSDNKVTGDLECLCLYYDREEAEEALPLIKHLGLTPGDLVIKKARMIEVKED